MEHIPMESSSKTSPRTKNNFLHMYYLPFMPKSDIFKTRFSNYPAIQLLNLHVVSLYNLLTGQLTGMLILGLKMGTFRQFTSKRQQSVRQASAMKHQIGNCLQGRLLQSRQASVWQSSARQASVMRAGQASVKRSQASF